MMIQIYRINLNLHTEGEGENYFVLTQSNQRLRVAMPPRALLALFGRLDIARCPFRGVEPLDLTALRFVQTARISLRLFRCTDGSTHKADSKRLRRLLAEPLLHSPLAEGCPKGGVFIFPQCFATAGLKFSCTIATKTMLYPSL